ncbi:MAG: SH3 domain-containing protein, partial [Bacteroidota bacterium]
MNKLVLLLLVYLVSFTIHAQSAHDMLTVVAPSGLSLRDAPGQSATRIGIIPKGAKVRVLDYNQEKDKNLESIDGYYGYWASVNYQEQKGYVFSAYLYDGEPFV